VIHYHGTPITPRATLYELAGRNFCVSFANPRDTKVVHEIGQSVMLDNGAFTIWKQGGVPDWGAWADWVMPWLDYPTTWCVLPDVIDGSEEENDRLMRRFWNIPGAPVWHLHESLDRLKRLCDYTNRVCFGSSGAYATVGSDAWHRRIEEAFNAISDPAGRVNNWIHMLRGMSLSGSHYPFASVDSTDIARNHSQRTWTVAGRAHYWDSQQCPGRWNRTVTQPELEEVA
jgi:hypothetical protein